MPCLHILNKAPGHQRAYDCQAQLAAGDQLLLIENGVLAVADLQWLAAVPADVTAMSLTVDMEARGLIAHPEKRVQAVDYDRFVALAAAADKIQHW